MERKNYRLGRYIIQCPTDDDPDPLWMGHEDEEIDGKCQLYIGWCCYHVDAGGDSFLIKGIWQDDRYLTTKEGWAAWRDSLPLWDKTKYFVDWGEDFSERVVLCATAEEAPGIMAPNIMCMMLEEVDLKVELDGSR